MWKRKPLKKIWIIPHFYDFLVTFSPYNFDKRSFQSNKIINIYVHSPLKEQYSNFLAHSLKVNITLCLVHTPFDLVYSIFKSDSFL